MCIPAPPSTAHALITIQQPGKVQEGTYRTSHRQTFRSMHWQHCVLPTNIDVVRVYIPDGDHVVTADRGDGEATLAPVTIVACQDAAAASPENNAATAVDPLKGLAALFGPTESRLAVGGTEFS